MTWLVCDAEWGNPNPPYEGYLEVEDVTTLFCICCYDIISETLFEFGVDEILNGLELLNRATRIIGHNLYGADFRIFKKLYDWEPRKDQIILDTLLLSRLSFPDRSRPFGCEPSVKPHSIEAWALRIGKGQKKVHEDWTKFSPEMLERCKQDVLINVDVYKALCKEML